MRLYLAAGPSALRSLRDGQSVTLPAFAAASEDEEDEFAALEAAAESGPVVVADVDEVDPVDEQTVTLDQVVALHADVDGSGDLAWFATQEIDTVLDLLA